MSSEVDRLLGRVAVERGWLAEPRLALALAAQERAEADGRPRRLLGALLVERQELTEAQVAELLDAQARAALTDEDALFGATLVRNGLATWEAVGRALGAQLAMPLPKRLGELLRERGEISEQALAATVRAQERMGAKLAAPSPAAADVGLAAAAPATRRVTPPGDTLLPEGVEPLPSDATVSTAQHPAPAGPPPPPLVAGRYEVLAKLGEGGMGVVHRVRDRQLGREVALKLLLRADRADDEDVDRFSREVRAAAGLSHPGIIRIHDVGLADGKPYYTMEIVEGEELESLIRSGRLSPRDAVEVTLRVAEALEFAHAHGVLHRDIKPRNIIVQLDGQAIAAVKLLDFGIAKFAEREVQMPREAAGDLSPEARAKARAKGEKSLRTLTRTGQLMGTPLYMSPEQLDEAGAVDGRADVYSLGASLYEMLTGRTPFHESPSLANLLFRIKDEDPLPPRRLVPDLDLDTETIALKCLAKAPKDRYDSAGALAEDCRRRLADEPIAARPVGRAARLWRRARRNRRIALPFGALSLLLLAVGAYFAAGAIGHALDVRKFRGEADALLAEAAAATGDERKARLDEALLKAGSLLALSPRDSRVLDLVNHVRSELSVAKGDGAFDRYKAGRRSVEEGRRACEAAERTGLAAKLHKDKGAMWDLKEGLRAAEEEQGRWSADAISAYTEAVGYETGNASARQRLAELYWDKYQDAERRRDLAEQKTCSDLLKGFGGPEYEERLLGTRRVRVRFLLPAGFGGQGAAGASVRVVAYLHRYELNKHPPVLVPVPCDPETGRALGKPELPPAEPVPVEDVPVPGAEGTAGAQSAQSAAARAVREARWGSVFRLREIPENRVELLPPAQTDGTAAAERPAVVFERRLPKGSYLLHVPPGQGLYETRYPFEVARDFDWDEACELVAEDDAPPLPAGVDVPPTTKENAGDRALYWSYLPAGPYRASGDPGTQQSPPRDAAWIRLPEGEAWTAERRGKAPPPRPTGVFLARFEVTTATYLAYLDDRGWQKADAAFKRAPRSAMVATDETAYWPRGRAGRFDPRGKVPAWRDDWPIFGISGEDATDCARWLAAQHAGGGWEVRLPLEDEWEKAARGVDGRFHPWGDEFDPTFCRMADSRPGEAATRLPEPFGLFRLDEGPHGVRDLAGGMREWTATPSGASGEYRIVKGGAWGGPASLCRGADRFASGPGNVFANNGLRLAAARTR
ncbi:MAG: SUMF1/EgtB/PvdO family nonheme iron enzyme [Planctomycetes bacterium]|nr:SUMF1/EgtB/PvdO family nonheme iron enzyme [Planctomycetota bacterium]